MCASSFPLADHVARTRAGVADCVRCAAFAVAAALSVLLPIGQVFTSLPLLGPLLIMSWAWWIVSRGAIQVFHVAPQRANAGFAVIYAALAILSFL